MPAVRNPVPPFLEATDAATKVIKLQRDLFLLEQELKTLKQIKRTLWLGLSIILLNLFLTFVFFWFSMALHEHGWSSLSLVGLSILFFGTVIGICLYVAQKASRNPINKTRGWS